jgi:cytochrome o ubiquinol oxidase subunit 2
MAMPGVNGGSGPQDGSTRVEGALMKDADEKGNAPHWSAPATTKSDGGNNAPGASQNRNHTQMIPVPTPGTQRLALG